MSLAAIIGRPVHSGTPGVAGRRVGRLKDLVVDVSTVDAPVTAAVVGGLRRTWWVTWGDVILDQSQRLWVPDPGAREPSTVGPHEVLLVRDVLDTRVYDPDGRVSVRVGDVWLDQSTDGSVTVAGLEVGPRVLLRRVGLRRRRPGEGSLLPLSQVHLTSLHGHRVQLAAPTSPVHRLKDEDLAHLLTHLPVTAAADVVRELPHETVSSAVDYLHPHVARRLNHAVEGLAQPSRRLMRSAGWRLYRPRSLARRRHPSPPPRSHR